mmetsp:Transcript_28917/g.24286  ORF Transcript_28917/g.24286 Transcript_28917/m.24286 type:complete len:82 (+) Transcript_28917:332-577(+)
MGVNIGIGKEIMKTMIKEIDVNGDGTIEVNEWIEYIRVSRSQDKLDLRGQYDNNILLDLLDKNKGERTAMRRKKNFNLQDD